MFFRFFKLALLLVAIGGLVSRASADEFVTEAAVVRVCESDGTFTDGLCDFVARDDVRDWQDLHEQTSPIQQTMLLQPTPFLQPQVESRTQLQSLANNPRGIQGATLVSQPISRLRPELNSVRAFGTDLVQGSEAIPLISTDVGSLLEKSPSALSVQSQRRTPIVNDPRVRGSRIGSLAASGSYWVPARADLDSVLSKIDSRLLNNALITPGPFSSRYGPGFQFVDFEVKSSPRFESQQTHGRTAFDHQSNGNQWLGLQTVETGDEDWGVSASYTHRYGQAYRTGSGDTVNTDYESRTVLIAAGRDFGDERTLEMSLMRLDQTDVEFPGYVFDIDGLFSDAYSIAYTDGNPVISDNLETEFWYNRTRFDGNAQNPAKRRQFPFLDTIDYVGRTDVDSMSTGYRQAASWTGAAEDWTFTIGHDLRFIKQELNEIADATTFDFGFPVSDRNSPIPRSFSVNPGVYFEYDEQLTESHTFRGGGRVDYVQTDLVNGSTDLNEVGLDFFPATFAEIVGTDQTQTDRVLLSLYSTLTRQHSDELVSSASLGYAERAPSLTSLYAAQPFLLVLQNGLNAVTGNPELDKEKLIQFDVSLDYDSSRFRAGVRGFYGWSFDYITFENTDVIRSPADNEVQQVSLRYVNTDLATLAGVEAFAELFPQARLTPFVQARGIDGRDRTRNGDFATRDGSAANASTEVPTLDRGAFSGILGSDSEPLPGISPVEMRLGVRLRDQVEAPAWNVELSARVVDNQDRVATSLLETPTSGFTVFDLRSYLRPRFADGLLVIAGVENFTDKTYQEHLDFRSPSGVSVLRPGVNFYAGMDWAY